MAKYAVYSIWKKLHHLTCIIKISSTRLCLHTQKKKHTKPKGYSAMSAIMEIFHALSNCKTEKKI